MSSPTKDRIELVLMADDAKLFRFWVEAPAGFARRYEFKKDKSLRILGSGAILAVLTLYLFPAASVMTSLLGLIIVFPLSLVGMMGFSREP